MLRNILILVLLMITFNANAQILTYDNEIGQQCLQIKVDSIVENQKTVYYFTYVLCADLSDYDRSIVDQWDILSDDQKSEAKILWLFTDKLNVELFNSTKIVAKNE